jgi:hypothetical protein
LATPDLRAELIGTQMQQSLGWRRIAAFGVDYGFILPTWGCLPWLACLAALLALCPPTPRRTPYDRIAGTFVTAIRPAAEAAL